MPRKYSFFEHVFRFAVPDEKTSWSSQFPLYKPNAFTAEVLLKQPVWADPIDPTEINKEDFNKNLRKSYCGLYKIDAKNRPINPVGRTGICDRGVLGKWGPNFAADPLVVRKNPENSKKLQFVAIQRKDTKEWAIPGGMVENGDTVSATLRKEFLEETQNILEKSPAEAAKLEQEIKILFENPTKILYKGYVDDPRNTDNSWMETTCTLFYDSDGSLTKNLKLEAGDDAAHVKWVDIELENPEFKLYASHMDFVKRAVDSIRL